MNTYNENLHSNVVASLQSLELDQKSKKSKRDASIFTLYYAEGARLTADEKLEADTKKYDDQKTIKTQAVTNSNIAINLLDSANQQKQFTAQAVTNAAVCASNIQIASNAIVKLASDIAGVYSILNAADYHSEIYLQSKEAYDLINMTAYDVEKASQAAMDASKLMAEVSSSTVADEARATNAAMTTILNIANTGFEAISATVTADHKSISVASAAEKKAEGVLEFCNAEYFSTQNAYQINNRELNLNLHVPEKSISNEQYTVQFNYYHSPFTSLQTTRDLHFASHTKAVSENPVKNYYIMLVKDSVKSTFSIAKAESITPNEDQRVFVPGAREKKDHSKNVSKTIYISDLLDSDGDKMELGKPYTVFVLTVFTEEFKKRINNFDDYLSAPSEQFTLTNKLAKAKNVHVPIHVSKSQYQKLDFIVSEEHSVLSNNPKIKHNKDGLITEKLDVEYRCVFLPSNKELTSDLLSASGLRTIEKEVEKLERIANKYDPELAKYDALITSLESESASLTTEIKDPEKQKEIAKLIEKQKKINREIKEATVIRNRFKKERDEEMKTIEPAEMMQPGFFFNLKLAEQISADNYEVAELHLVSDENGIVKLKGNVEITETTTDNFGNLLVDTNLYIPVVLSYSTALEENIAQYTNTLSDFEKLTAFNYQAKNVTPKN
jgi:hypothetical protein